MTIQMQFNMVGLGLQQAACSVVGMQIGKGNVEKAKEYFKVTLVVSACTLILVVLLVFLL